MDEQDTTTVFQEAPAAIDTQSLIDRYKRLLDHGALGWMARYRVARFLGAGGQGVVFQAERLGADEFRIPVALKIFDADRYIDRSFYLDEMAYLSHLSSRIALIQHDHLLSVHNFVEHGGRRLMVMEWVDGFDLDTLLRFESLDLVKLQSDPERFAYLLDVVVDRGRTRCRLKPGIAIHVLRECLTALAALHRNDIVHGDLKPSNIMLKRTGSCKVIDLCSAMDLQRLPARRMLSPVYVAPEIHRGQMPTPLSDLASLGYVLIELLSGVHLFRDSKNPEALLHAKRLLPDYLEALLPQEIASNPLLVGLCRKLVAFDPLHRFPDADTAELGKEGAGAFHRQLIKSDLASEYANDIRVWVEAIL